LSVGCGGCRDIAGIEKYIRDVQCDIVLHDVDSDALELSRNRLGSLRAKVHSVNGNFLQSLRKVERLGPFDVILAGGLFDYLTDKHILFFLKKVSEDLLAQNSILFFSNIKKDNPFKVWQEYLADWRLVYRTEDDIISLLAAAGFPDDAVRIEKDETGLTFLVTVKR